MKILIAYDGSKDGTNALQQAITFVQNSDNTLSILVVREPTVTFQYSANVPFSDPQVDTGDLDMKHIRERLETREHTHWQGILDGAKDICRKAGVDYHGIYVAGEPRTMICEVARQEKADLLIMGSRGLGMLQRLLLGSASEYAIKHAPCSVLVARKER